MVARFRSVFPGDLRLPATRTNGADPFKLGRQIGRFANGSTDMPTIQVVLCGDGELMIWDGVTRATRLATLAPMDRITVEILDEQPALHASRFPRVKERL